MRPLLSECAYRRRLKAIQPYLRGHVLDVGCGWTHLPSLLGPSQSYVGVDADAAALGYGVQCYPQHAFVCCDIDLQLLNLGDILFDTAVMMAVLEHLVSPERVLKKVRSVLSPQGRLLLTTPSPAGNVIHVVGARLGLFCSERVVRHVRIWRRRELERLLAECGYRVVRFRYFVLGANQLIVCRLSG